MKLRAAIIVIASAGVVSPALAQSSLQQMERVFVGSPAQSTLKFYLDAVLSGFGEPVSETTYKKLGSLLLVMRKESGAPELEILKCMKTIADKKGRGTMNLSTAAASCASAIE